MQKGKKNKNLVILTGVAGGLIVICIGVVAVLIIYYTSPLGSSLNETIRNVQLTTPTTEGTKMVIPLWTATPNLPAGVCGETAVWNILVLGSDAGDLYYPQGSDLTRVVRVDFQSKKVSIFAFSRDLWVDVNNLNLANPSITSTKLGMAFYEASNRSIKTDPQGAMLDGVGAMAKTLEANFTLISDHYIAIDLEKLPEMVDAIGGLPINIPNGFTDPLSGVVFSAGQQTLSGAQTANYVRAYVDNDLNRIPRNNLVVEALHQKLLDMAVWMKIPQLYFQFKDAVVTDFSPEQVSHLACLMKELPEGSITQDGVKAEWTSPGPEGSLLWDRTNMLNRLKELGVIP